MENKLDIYKQLSADLSDEAVERAPKEITRKGYDTTGYAYQFIVNRFNEVLGIENWNFNYKILKEMTGKFQSGQEFFDITVEVEIIVNKECNRSCVGGHKSGSYSDALKGAITNAFKKTASFFGVGKKAYEGMIDEDYRKSEEVKEYNKQQDEPFKGNEYNTKLATLPQLKLIKDLYKNKGAKDYSEVLKMICESEGTLITDFKEITARQANSIIDKLKNPTETKEIQEKDIDNMFKDSDINF